MTSKDLYKEIFTSSFLFLSQETYHQGGSDHGQIKSKGACYCYMLFIIIIILMYLYHWICLVPIKASQKLTTALFIYDILHKVLTTKLILPPAIAQKFLHQQTRFYRLYILYIENVKNSLRKWRHFKYFR